MTTKRNGIDENSYLDDSAEKPDIATVAAIIRSGVHDGKTPHITVISNSMAPLLRRGDTISVTNCLASKLEPGDIILLQAHDSFVTHRYRGVVPNTDGLMLITRGDRSIRFDPLWPATALVGRVTSRKRAHYILALETGVGSYLNRHLAFVATAEERLCGDSGFRTRDEWDSAEKRLITATRHPQKLIRYYARGIHLGLAIWSHLIVAVAARLATVTKPRRQS
ncbi:MAG: hypothetical protein M9918_14215 [Anaerolineae bacterium]|nr:hypothetical protein [Anaerolineae bacterium]